MWVASMLVVVRVLLSLTSSSSGDMMEFIGWHIREICLSASTRRAGEKATRSEAASQAKLRSSLACRAALLCGCAIPACPLRSLVFGRICAAGLVHC